MCLLRWLCGNTLKDKIRNEDVKRKVGFVDIEDNKGKLIVWFGHVKRGFEDVQ